ncbi:[protein-PII] uridylyltransferase [Stenoxybacter acetivorans]|uniref:[protein-PII] uridylyltransferase n=1 Tax=Stenoxybacter acetivorans TaxID=422441 RepID=UPI00056C9394|nr:[protein-PII] uridylyltransferase [Stenoxybacter acetivorans]
MSAPLPCKTCQAVAQELTQKKQQIIQNYLNKRRISVFFQQSIKALEYALAVLWQEWFHHDEMCLLATGGFGRGEIYPYSDLDLAIVTANAPDADLQERIATFVQALWDMNLMPAAKIGTVAELCISAHEDLTGDTAFLESRFICGKHQLADRLISCLNQQRDVAVFIEGKLLEQQQRYNKAQGSASQLEANVKTAPGGLRDIHTMMWLAQVQGIRPNFHYLVQQHILTRNEAALLIHSHRQLAKIRIDLHLVAGRAEERLIFDLQSQVAQNMGFQDDNKYRKSEKLMHVFYRATKSVKQLNDIILPMLRGRVYSVLPRITSRIDENYYQVNGLLAVDDKKLFQKKPSHIFQAAALLQQHPEVSGMAPQTLRGWWGAAQTVGADFYQNIDNRRLFIGFFKHGSGLTHLLRFLNLYGVLGRYLPAWQKIVGLLQHDLFHIYPVDDHILMVVRNMRRLAMDEHSHELPFASGLMYSFEEKHLLYLAAFFHDIAKGRGGDHAVEGVADARRFAEDHFLNTEETDLLTWLVEDHLLMSATAQKEDIQDAAVIAKFCNRVKTRRRLTALYLLTVADIRGTNPKIWNSWKAGLLENLFQAALKVLSGEQHDQTVVVSNRQQRALNELSRLNIQEQQQRQLWKILGKAYFVRHEMQEILWHLPFLINHEHEAQAHIRLLPGNDAMQVMVYLPNREKLFACLCTIFSRHDLNILAARAHITEHDFILDTFIIGLPEGCQPHDLQRLQRRVQESLNQFISTPNQTALCNPIQKSIGRRSRHLPIAPQVEITPEEDKTGWYILEIITFNRRYLLANIAEILAEMNISLKYAKIATLDERVEDSFLIYAPQLENPAHQLALKQALLSKMSQ